MDWEKIGIELPVATEKGDRPAIDEETGQARDTEVVPHPGTEHLSFRFNDMAKVSDRRLLDSLTDNMARQKASSPGYSADFDMSLGVLCSRFVVAVRDESDNNREYKGEKIGPFLLEALEYDDALNFIYWLKYKSQLARSKKKN